MAARFNPPPGWPPPPQGWTPPPGWAPDPAWPAPPPGWQLWIDDAPPTDVPAPGAPDVSRFAGPDAAATQTFQAPGAPYSHGASAPVGGPAAFPAPDGAQPGLGAQPGFGAQSGFDAQPGSWQGGPGAPAGPPSGGKQWLIPVIIAVVAVLAIGGVLIATGVIGGGDSQATQSEKSAKPTATTAQTPSEEPSEEPSDEPSDDPSQSRPVTDNGTRDVPLAVGATATVFDWSVSMGVANLDAWGEISTVVDEYFVPEEGHVYVMAPATVQFNGPDRLYIDDLDWAFVSAMGKTYQDECGYATLPDGLDIYQELYSGGTDSGNVCVTVPADEAAGGVWRVSSYGDFNGTYEAYFALS